MKRMKKLFAILMTMAMVMGLGITGFAAETTNVKVEVSNVDGADLYYDQIVKADASSTDGWAYTDDYKRFFGNVSIGDLVGIAKGTQNGDASTGKLTESSKLAAVLDDLRSTVQVEENKVSGNTFTATSGGLYVVVPSKPGYTYSPTLVYVPVNETTEEGEAVTVQTKGSKDQIKKDIETNIGESVSAGDIVKYTVTVEYPTISANYSNPSFKITDTLTNGTFLIDENHPVTVSNGITGYTVSNANGTNSLEINFTSYDRSKAGTTFTITYYVEVADTVSSGSPLENKVVSELQVDPDGDTTKTEYEVVSTPVRATIDKVDDETNKLLGAVFAIYNGTANDEIGDTLVSIVADATNTDGITLPTEYQQYQNLLKADGTADGTVVFDGLDAQKEYYVVEIIAPTGYQIDGLSHQLISGGEASDSPKEETNTDELTGVTTITKTYKFNDFKVNENNNNVVNTKISALPETGGMGTTLFTIAGCVIMISAAGLFFATRKKAN